VTEPYAQVRRGPKTVLVVGSDNNFTGQVSAALPAWNVEHTETNLQALKLVEERAFDLMITGEETSGKVDVELLREIRQVRPHTRLIILTNLSTPSDVIASIRERAFSYFSRPFSQASLAEMLRLAAEAESWDDGIEVISATPDWIRLAARCDRRTADRLLQFFHEIVQLPDQERDQVATAFREMLLNAMEHGAGFDPTQYVEISYVRARHMILCRVKDPGEGFSLDEIQHAAVSNPPDDPLRHQAYREAKGLRPGGFGVLLTRGMVDELIYGEKGNEVLIVKYVELSVKRSA